MKTSNNHPLQITNLNSIINLYQKYNHLVYYKNLPLIYQ